MDTLTRQARRKTRHIVKWIKNNYEIALPMTIAITVVVGGLIEGFTTGHW